MTTPRVTYISWAESCSRSDYTARELGGTSHMVYLPQFGSRAATIVLKYVGQWLMTSRILARERPDAVFVMTPPVFAALPAFWYAWRRRKDVVLDAHTAAFLLPRWRYFQWLQHALCRRAATTLVSNEYLAERVRSAGGHATLVPDVPVIYDEQQRFVRTSRFTVAVVCSFNYDEPVVEILEAAASLPDVDFFLTGNPAVLRPEVHARRPSNVTFTGFLATAAYAGLLADADVVVALTTFNHTMLRGAYEAIYQGTPVVVSNWPLLRDAFPDGAVHVDNTPVAIAAGVRAVQGDPDGYRAAARRLRERKLTDWQATKRAIEARLGRAKLARTASAAC